MSNFKCSVRPVIRAFTLIELFGAIAIIALIAAVLFPVYSSAREKSRQSECLSNEKQLGLAITQYEQDFDEMTPCGTNRYGGGAGWGGQVYGYVKNVAVFKCPDDTLAGLNTISYAYNANLAPLHKPSKPRTEIGTILSQFTEPDKTILFCEIQNDTSPTVEFTLPNDPIRYGQPASPTANGTGVCEDPTGYNDSNCNDKTHQPLTATSEKYATGWFHGMAPGLKYLNTLNFENQTGVHNGGSNYIFADCHAKWLPGTAISGGYNNMSAKAANFCGDYNAGSKAYYSAETKCSDATIVGTFSYH